MTIEKILKVLKNEIIKIILTIYLRNVKKWGAGVCFQGHSKFKKKSLINKLKCRCGETINQTHMESCTNYTEKLK